VGWDTGTAHRAKIAFRKGVNNMDRTGYVLGAIR